MKSRVYSLLLQILNLTKDFRNNTRTHFGVSPYIRRSPIILTVLNFQELFRFLLQPRFTKNKMQTEALQGSRKGQTALVIGNGPSCKKINFNKVNSDSPDVWVVNDFYKLDPDNLLKVTHYVLSDSDYFNPEEDGNNSRLSNVIDYISLKSAFLVVPHWACGNRQVEDLPRGRVVYFDDRELSAWSKNIYPNKPRGYLGLTLYKALGFALFLGYQEIFVIGMDNSEFLKYSSDKDNRLLLLGNHAYKDQAVPRDFSDHYLDGLAGALMHYAHALGDLNKFRGPIFNLDSESLTTAFTKISPHRWVV